MELDEKQTKAYLGDLKSKNYQREQVLKHIYKVCTDPSMEINEKVEKCIEAVRMSGVYLEG